MRFIARLTTRIRNWCLVKSRQMPAKHIHADPYRDLDRMLTYHAELDLALTYAMRRPNLARECATHAAVAAVHMGRPDLRAQANDVLVALNL